MNTTRTIAIIITLILVFGIILFVVSRLRQRIPIENTPFPVERIFRPTLTPTAVPPTEALTLTLTPTPGTTLAPKRGSKALPQTGINSALPLLVTLSSGLAGLYLLAKKR